MNILIFFPYNQRTVEQQSVMEALHKKGHTVILYTSCKRGVLHSIAEGLGIKALAAEKEYDNTLKNIWHNIFQLKKITKQYNIDFTFVHQQVPALTFGLLHIISKNKFGYIRHNSDEDYQNFPVKAKILNVITNLLTPIKIAPSLLVKKFWKEKEGVKNDTISIVHYGYNFDQYELPDQHNVKKIKAEYTAPLVIVSIARLVPQKRHKEMFTVIEQCLAKGINCQLICLGSGYLENELKQYISIHNLQKNIFLVGRKDNIFDYIAVADIFLHLSNSEASNSAVKEVALCSKPVIVCKEVGDFEEYITNGKNGFLVSRQQPVNESAAIIESVYNKTIDVNAIGEEFNSTVITIFNIDNVIDKYEMIIQATCND
ncbi:MAG TPA: glycosyltransferase [Ferruginibacter sp.]|nr:glycosyltransferase [Ferruginibacter sp.]